MKKIKSLAALVLMFTCGTNIVFATSDVPNGAVIEGVTSYDNAALTAVKFVDVPEVVWSTVSGINSALAVIPKGFGSNLGESIAGQLSLRTGFVNLTLTSPIGAFNNHQVTEMLFLSVVGITSSWTVANIFNNPLDTSIPPVSGGVMFSSNVIAATATAMINDDEVRTQIGSTLVYNTTTKTIETIDNVVVAITRL